MKIIFIGSGNLASHLSVALKESGHAMLQVYSRTLSHAQQLADALCCDATDSLELVRTDADAYIISIKDDAISHVAEILGKGREEAVFMHTAGSVSIQVLAKSVKHAAVLYPMQSFTKGRTLDFKKIPVFMEATDDISRICVKTLSESVSENVCWLDSDVRKKMHLAAVFACNMTNHCYRLAEKMVQAEGIDFKLFAPLIMETAHKAIVMSPRVAQTGPMVRNDVGVMQMQLEMIDNPLAKKIYKTIAESVRADFLDNYQENKKIT